MQDNFDLKKFLVENKLTTNSKLVNEQADHVSPMVVKAYKEYLQAKKEGDGEKAYRYYSKKLNNTYSTRADRDAIEVILKKKYGNALEEASKNTQSELDKWEGRLYDLENMTRSSNNPDPIKQKKAIEGVKKKIASLKKRIK